MGEDDDIRVVIPKDLMTREADSRGRVTLGSEYADKEVQLAVLEVQESDG